MAMEREEYNKEIFNNNRSTNSDFYDLKNVLEHHSLVEVAIRNTQQNLFKFQFTGIKYVFCQSSFIASKCKPKYASHRLVTLPQVGSKLISYTILTHK